MGFLWVLFAEILDCFFRKCVTLKKFCNVVNFDYAALLELVCSHSNASQSTQSYGIPPAILAGIMSKRK